jgi:RNA polymerase sigma factor (sigma-70 family)
MVKDFISEFIAQSLRYPRLTHAEEIELGRIVQEGGPGAAAAKNRFIVCNLRLVVSITKKYVNSAERPQDFQDALQDGAMGLQLAAEKFNPSRGRRFSTMAYQWIKQGITRGLTTRGRTIRIPGHAYNFLAHARKVKAADPTKTIAELAESVGCSEAVLRNGARASCRPSSLDRKVSGGDGARDPLGAFIASEGTSPYQEAILGQHLPLAEQLLGQLPDDVESIVRQAYGIGAPKRSWAEIGKPLGLTHNAIRQKVRRAEQLLADRNSHVDLTEYDWEDAC